MSLVEALRPSALDGSPFASELADSKREIGIPDSFEKLGPADRLKAPKCDTPGSHQLIRFLSDGAKNNVTVVGQVRPSIPSHRSQLVLLDTGQFAPFVHRPFPNYR